MFQVSKPKYKINAEHKAIVEAAGADYVSEGDLVGPIVFFNSRQSRSTLCISVKELTTQAVYDKLVKSNRDFGLSTPELTIHAERH